MQGHRRAEDLAESADQDPLGPGLHVDEHRAIGRQGPTLGRHDDEAHLANLAGGHLPQQVGGEVDLPALHVGDQPQGDGDRLLQGVAHGEDQLVGLAGAQRLVGVDVALAALGRVAGLMDDDLDAPVTGHRRRPEHAAFSLTIGRHDDIGMAHRLERHADAKVSHPELELGWARVHRVVAHHIGADAGQVARQGRIGMDRDLALGVDGPVAAGEDDPRLGGRLARGGRTGGRGTRGGCIGVGHPRCRRIGVRHPWRGCVCVGHPRRRRVCVSHPWRGRVCVGSPRCRGEGLRRLGRESEGGPRRGRVAGRGRGPQLVPELVAGQVLTAQGGRELDAVVRALGAAHRGRVDRQVALRVGLHQMVVFPGAVVVIDGQAPPALSVGGRAAQELALSARADKVRAVHRDRHARQRARLVKGQAVENASAKGPLRSERRLVGQHPGGDPGVGREQHEYQGDNKQAQGQRTLGTSVVDHEKTSRSSYLRGAASTEHCW